MVVRSLNIVKYRRAALSLRLLYAAAGVVGTGRRYDVVHCEFGHLGILGLRLKQIGALRGTLVTSFRGNDSTGFLRAHPGVYRELFAQGDLFCPVSESLRQRIVAAGCPAKRTVIVHSGIDLTALPHRPPYRKADEPTRLLTVGRLVEKKGIEYAVRAVGHLVKSGRQVRLTVAGDGPLGSALAQLIGAEGLQDHVRLIGWVDDDRVPGLLREAHILVAPSVTAASGDTEGIPNTVKEAMASGLPVVSTWHGGVPELVEDGVSGLLAPEKDAAALADRLAYLIDHPDLWRRLSQAARHKVEAEFDIEALNDKLLGLYRGLTGDPEMAASGNPASVRTQQCL
jgi:colanic acid/amylovoran biosynthesis glycosyltransferase